MAEPPDTRPSPYRLGLTGSVGMGKSTTAQMFRDAGIPVYDADQAVHDLYLAEAVEPVRRRFPTAISHNRVDRTLLKQELADDPDALADLERIVHPLVHARERQFLAEMTNKGADLVVLDIPLLFETGADGRVDGILVVTAPAAVQKARVMARPGMTRQLFDAIISRQLPDAQKRQRADFVIDTSLGLDAARVAVGSIIATIRDKTAEQKQER